MSVSRLIERSFVAKATRPHQRYPGRTKETQIVGRLRYRRKQTMRERRMATKTAMKLLQREMESGMPSEGEQGYLNGYQRDRNQSRTRGNRFASPALICSHHLTLSSDAASSWYKPTLLERVNILRPGAFNSFATTIQMAPLATPFIGIASDHMWSHVCRSSSCYPTVR